jgi:hypothetical protein
MDCYQKIDRFFEKKCRELEQLLDEKIKKPLEEIVRIQSKVTNLIR